jgi:2-iminoacetate synthase
MSFLEIINGYSPVDVVRQIEAKTLADVDRALAQERLRPDDLMALLSPAAEERLELMAQKAHQITRRRFGKTILLYAPIYLSNECSNGCLYCGFNATNKTARRTLNLDEIEREARVLHTQGFRHVLLVTGEAPGKFGNDQLEAAVQRIKPLFSSVSIEVYPMDEDGYRRMVGAGVDGLTIYQALR